MKKYNFHIYEFKSLLQQYLASPLLKFVHTIFGRVKFGKKVYIEWGAKLDCLGSRKRPGIEMGDGTKIKSGARLHTRSGFIKLGKGVSINPNTVLLAYGGITIGNNCRIAAGTSIVAFNHNYLDKDVLIYKQGSNSKGIKMEDDVWIGTNCSILDGVTIGEGAVIGASTVVTKDVPPYAVVVGNPGRVLKYRESLK